MSEIFRSKEVYKHPPKSLHNKNEMIPVRGVYVTGEYRPPYYDENGVSIVDIGGNKANVVNFTDETISSGYDAVLRVLKFNIDPIVPDITQYTTNTVSSGYDAVLRVLKFDIDPVMPDCLFYTQETASTGYDFVLRVLGFDIEPMTPTTQIYTKRSQPNTPEPMLRLTSIQTEKAEVSNYLP